MNKRIYALAKEAGMRSPDLFKLTISHMSTDTLEMFAELIVRECVAQCEFVAGQAEITNTGEMARKTKATANSCAQMIKQHFGVEDRAIPILSADEQALFAGIASSKLFTIEGAKKQFGVEE